MPSRRLTDCEPDLMQRYLVAREVYEEANKGHKLVTDCTARTADEQLGLFKQGRVERDGVWVEDDIPTTFIVTKLDGTKKRSYHNFTPSRAVDFHLEINGKPVWDVKAYVPIGAVMQQYSLRWGGTWGKPATWAEIERKIKAKEFIDACHVELPE